MDTIIFISYDDIENNGINYKLLQYGYKLTGMLIEYNEEDYRFNVSSKESVRKYRIPSEVRESIENNMIELKELD